MTYTTETVHSGSLVYRIEVRQIADGSWQQRHIWDGVTEDAWIPTSRFVGETFSRRADVKVIA